MTERNQASEELRGSDHQPDDPGFLESVFREGFEKTCQLLDDPKIDDFQALTWILRGRNKVLDETGETYAKAARADMNVSC